MERLSKNDEVTKSSELEFVVTRGHWGHTELLSWATEAVYGERVFLSAKCLLNTCQEPSFGYPSTQKGGSESSSNCLWLLLIPLVSLLFSSCSNTLAFPLVLGCTELTYVVACLLTATCPALQSSATPDILSRPST